MPIKIETKQRHLHVTWSGSVTTDDLRALFRGLPTAAATCGFPPHVLHTMDGVADLQLGTWDACDYSLRRARTEVPVRTKAAFVATTPVAGAMARVFAGFNGNPNLEMQTFPNEAEALAWLGVGSGPAD